MATTETFNDMLKKYMPYQLLIERMAERNWFWNKVKKDEKWFGGTLQYPFEGGEASSLSYGSLTGSTDIAENTAVLGTISSFRELWGAMIFNEKDLDLHGSMEASFLTMLPRMLNQFTSRMSQRASHNFLNGAKVDILQADGDDAGTGILNILHPERFTIGEKLTIDDDNSSSASVYVIAIDVNAKTITVSSTRGGSATSQSAYTTAQNAALWTPGGDSVAFSSVVDALLPAANGGSATIAGQTKTSYPFLQAIYANGNDITSANILEKVFDHFITVHTLGKGNPTEVLMSFKNFANCAKSLEPNRDYTSKEVASGYGFRTINVVGPQGGMDITALRDMDDDKMYFMDWDTWKFHGSHFFDRKRHHNGDEFFTVRATTGYSYIVDIRLYGDLVCSGPSHNGALHSISY